MKGNRRYHPTPRILTAGQVATRLGKSEGWFSSNRGKLEAHGFPLRIQLLNGWDEDAIEAWIDQLSGLHFNFSATNEWDEVLHAAKGAARRTL